MAFKWLYVFGAVLVNVLAVAVTSSARSTGLVRELRDKDGNPYYSWLISKDEEERLSALLEADFYDTGVEATYVTGPPRVCPYCGKDTEFIDWVYTALKRGVHSPEFIFESLKAGRSPKGVHHDVYCSGCGHLTHARDRSGNEGGALHITHATPYGRSTKTFFEGQISSETSDQTVLWIPSDPWFRRRVDHTQDKQAIEIDPKTTDQTVLWIPSDPWFRRRVGQTQDEQVLEVDPESSDQTVLWIPSDPWFRRRVGQTSGEPAVEASFDPETSDDAVFWIPSNPWTGRRIFEQPSRLSD